MSTRKFYDDPFTLLHLDTTAIRPSDIYVEDVLNLDGTELTPDFDARLDNELVKVTAVVLDGGGAGIDKWTIAHLGGAAASIHKAGSQVDVVLTANGLTIGLLDYFVGAPASPAEGDTLYYHSGAWSRLPIGTVGKFLQTDGTDPSWQLVPFPAAGGTFTGDVEFEADIIDDTEAAGTAGQVLTKVSGHPRWADPTGGMTNPMTTTGDIIYSSSGSTPARLGIGTNEYVLTVDTATGLPKWKASAGGGGGGSSASNVDYCRIYRNSAYALVGGVVDTLYPFNTVDLDGNSMADVASNRITIATTGKYVVNVGLYKDVADRFIIIIMNGATVLARFDETGNYFVEASSVVNLTAGDHITAHYLSQSGSAIITDAKADNFLEVYRIDGGTGPITPNTARIYRNAAYTTITGYAITKMPCDAQDYDSNGSMVNLGSNRIDIKVAGRYIVTGDISLNATGDIILYLYKNGSVVRQYHDTTSGYGLNFSAEVDLAVNDYLELFYATGAAIALYETPAIAQNSLSAALLNAGMSNPMTDMGSIIYASNDSGNPVELNPDGHADGEVLTLASGIPSWAAASGGGTATDASYSTAVLADSPRLFYKMTGLTGTSPALTDSGSDAINGTSSAGVTAHNSGGPYTGGYFDFAAAECTITTKPTNAGATPLTLEFWAYFKTNAYSLGIFDSAPSTGGTFRNYNNTQWEINGSAAFTITLIQPKGWHHFAIVVNAGSTFIYVDGTLTSPTGNLTNTNGAGAFTWNNTWKIGSINGGGAGNYDGYLAYFAYYDKLLTQRQIMNHLLAGTSVL